MPDDMLLTFGFISEIVGMYYELRELNKEVVRLREIERKHNKFVRESIKNSQE